MASLSARTVFHGGSALLVGVFLCLAAVAVWLPTAEVTYGLALALALAALPFVVWGIGQHPLAPLAGALLFFGFISRNKAGIQPAELAFAAYYLGFLTHWFVSRALIYRERVIRGPVDLILVGFLLYMTASVGLTLLYGGDLSMAMSEWVNYSMFAFYFPLREAVERYDVGRWVIAGLVLYLGVFAGIRNVLILQSVFSGADHARAIAGGRIPMNEMILLVSSLGCVTALGYLRSIRWRLAAVPVLGLLAGALILSQSRAYYVDLALGVLLLLVLLPKGKRSRAFLTGAFTLVVMVTGAYVVFGEAVLVLQYGLLNRVVSLATATQVDISLLNRFIETEAVWREILHNPIAGYGLGVSFTFYDAIFDGNWTKPYAHNGYLTLWYKFGIFGLLAVLAIWGRGIANGFRVAFARIEDLSPFGIWTAASLIALLPSHASSATFGNTDTVLTFTILLGVAAGVAGRLPKPPSDPTPGPEEAGLV